MIELKTPRGLQVFVPEGIAEEKTPRFNPDQLIEINKYYLNNGYVVVSGLVDLNVCHHLRQLWENKVKKTKKYIYRQATAKAERHIVNDNGWIMNPILNLQSLDPEEFGEFREYATNKMLTADKLKNVFKSLLNDDVKIVQSMYFEGNSATWEHHDSYYLDSEDVGRMAAAWIALETIEAEAGRFFICPGSHKINYEKHGADNNIADNHDIYIDNIVKKMKELNLEIRAPSLDCGDVLFWNSRTIHGSLDSQHATRSRSSVTCHAIPASRKFLQLQLRTLDVATDTVNGVHIYRPKDLAKLKNRVVLWIESHFARLFYWLKRMAIRQLAAKAAG